MAGKDVIGNLYLTQDEFDALPDRTAEEAAPPPSIKRWRIRDAEGKWFVCGDREQHHLKALNRDVTLFSVWHPVVISLEEV